MSEKPKGRRPGRADLWLLLIAGLVILFLFLFRAFYIRGEGQYVLVTVDGEEKGTYPLDRDCVIQIQGRDGKITNVLTIKEGEARMTEANCPDHLCMKQRPIHKRNETIVCLPNRVVVTAMGSEQGEMDAITR